MEAKFALILILAIFYYSNALPVKDSTSHEEYGKYYLFCGFASRFFYIMTYTHFICKKVVYKKVVLD